MHDAVITQGHADNSNGKNPNFFWKKLGDNITLTVQYPYCVDLQV